MQDPTVPPEEITHSEEDDNPGDLIGEPVDDPFPETWPTKEED